MTAKKAPSQLRSRRGGGSKATLALSPQFAAYQAMGSRDIEEAIEDERGQLMKAEAILHCVAIAMDEPDSDKTQAPCYQAALSVVRELVLQSINGLDSVRVRPMLERFLRRGLDGIKEERPGVAALGNETVTGPHLVYPPHLVIAGSDIASVKPHREAPELR